MKELGRILQTERERQNLTLDDIQDRTKIRKRYLQAIEEGDLSVLPGLVYARGFIKNYAEQLGLDGQELLREHHLLDESPSPKPGPVTAAAEPQPKSRAADEPRKKFVARSVPEGSRLLPQILMGAAIIGLLGVGYWFLTNRQATPEPAQPQAQQSNQQAQQPGQQPASQPQAPAPTPAEQKPTGPLKPETKDRSKSVYKVEGDKIKLQIKTANGKSWLDITTDGQKQYTQVADQGVTLSFEATQKIVVVTGYSPALTITVNEQPVELEQVNGRYEFQFQKK
ncbi:helix-turn-helix domain-containing protein [Effusibacillus pohliae]|uniref:helix-turn-helix domain-containing protein n=1 Tax=Effusibacillus pohliae TaxID=232270 RepID=UPI000367AB2E|nr:RodZ domain-containing protein [Effusibacillus pohliae]